MNRRNFVLGGLALAGGGLWWAKPGDNGGPYSPYFAALNAELKARGPMRPSLVIDLDRLDHNIAQVMQSVAKVPGRGFRIVEKSLPSPKLLQYIMAKAGTQRLMSFHQPFLNQDAKLFPSSDILVGKPLSVRSAELFYAQHQGPFNPERQLQWLIDTPEKLAHYLAFAQAKGLKLRVNIELDVGLHRGGVADPATLSSLLNTIQAHPQQLAFAGFMGYDPHIALVPSALGSPQQLLAKVMARYTAMTDHVQRHHAPLWQPAQLTLNTAGSPSYVLHEAETLSNDISVGTGLLKPKHYDLTTLSQHQPAAYIATPVLKASGPVVIPALDDKSKIFSWWDINQRQTFFIYGGNWMAEYENPPGLQFNKNFGQSSNQEIINAAPSVKLAVDDQVFFRPNVSEALLLEFGDLLCVRGGKLVDAWPVFSGA